MRIYRVEDSDGFGPYRGDALPERILMGHTSETGHPNALDDSPHLREAFIAASTVDDSLFWRCYVPPAYLLFGFHALGLMERWFSDCAEYLASHYHVSLYEVPDEHVTCGTYQAIFDKRYAVLVETYEIGMFWKIEKEERA